MSCIRLCCSLDARFALLYSCRYPVYFSVLYNDLSGFTGKDLHYRQFMNAYADAHPKYSLVECTRIGNIQYKTLLAAGGDARIIERTAEFEKHAQQKRSKKFGSILQFLKPKSSPSSTSSGSDTTASSSSSTISASSTASAANAPTAPAPGTVIKRKESALSPPEESTQTSSASASSSSDSRDSEEASKDNKKTTTKSGYKSTGRKPSRQQRHQEEIQRLEVLVRSSFYKGCAQTTA